MEYRTKAQREQETADRLNGVGLPILCIEEVYQTGVVGLRHDDGGEFEVRQAGNVVWHREGAIGRQRLEARGIASFRHVDTETGNWMLTAIHPAYLAMIADALRK